MTNLPLRKRRCRCVGTISIVLSVPWPAPVRPIDDGHPPAVDVAWATLLLRRLLAGIVPLQTGKVCRSNTTTDTSAIAIVTTLVERRVVLRIITKP